GDPRAAIEKQLTHLQRQRQPAVRHTQLTRERRELSAELFALRLNPPGAQAERQQAAQQETQGTLESALAARREIEGRPQQPPGELGERNEALNAVQGDYYRSGAEIARLQQSTKHRKDLIQRQREDLETTDQQLEE